MDVRARSTPAPARITGRRALVEQLDDRTDLLVAGSRDRRAGRLDLSVVGRRFVEQILGEREEDRPGPATERLADGLGHQRRDVLGGSRFDGPFCERPEGPDLVDLLEGFATLEGPFDLTDVTANIGVESCRAVWMPIAKVGATDRSRPKQTAGRPVSWPCASAMNDAPLLRDGVATTRMPAASNASSRPRKDSPGTVKA